MGKLTQKLRDRDKENSPGSSSPSNKNWLHPPEALQKGHIAYLVKFLGSTEVDQPKGIEVVKEGIRKLKFTQQLKKAEGTKTPKVELTVSIDGVAIHEPKTKKNLHQYPLHRISYCADDKAEKRFFSFIAKEPDSDKHTCFVFVSDKLAEEITLTIGQAFDLAYRRFVETSGRESEMRRQLHSLQKQVEGLQIENSSLKTRITQLATLKNRPDVEDYMKENNISDLLMLNGESSTDPENDLSNDLSSDLSSDLINSDPMTPPPLPPRTTPQDGQQNLIDSDMFSAPNGTDDDDFNPRANESISNIVNGQRDDEFDDFDPRAEEKTLSSYLGPAMSGPPSTAPPTRSENGFSSPPPLVPPPRPARPHERQNLNGLSDDIFSASTDPFASTAFTPTNAQTPDALAQFIEMKAGFSRGLSFGTADQDFTLESLDPLKN